MLSDPNESITGHEEKYTVKCAPFLGDKTLINQLVDCSDETKILKYTARNSINTCDLGEGICSWTQPASRRKYDTKQKRRKQVAECDKPKVAIRLVSDDYNNNFSSQFWKSNVEPGTFRYIPNNGQYRLSKMCREQRDWYTVRKKVAEKVTPTLQAIYAQREIKIMLRNDFDIRKSTKQDREDKGTKSACPEKSGETIKPKEIDSHLAKSASDLYIENIPCRLNVLEKEIKRDNALVRRTLEFDENAKAHPSRTKFKDQKVPKECFSSTSSANSTQGDSSSTEAFVIKAVGTFEKLRPLEKVTPQQRALQDVRNEKKPQKIRSSENAVSIEVSSVKSLGHEPSNAEDLQPTQKKITLTAENHSSFTERFENGTRENQCKCSKPQGDREIKSKVSVSSPELYPIDFEYASPSDEICGTKAIMSNRKSRNLSNKKQCSNLPDISGRRIQISVTSQRLL